MGKFRLLLPILLMIMLAGTVSAVNVNIQVDAVENNIFAEELAEFTLTVENRESEDLRLALVATDIEWTMITEPASHASVFEVPAEGSASTTIFLSPTNKQIQPGLHAVRVEIRDAATGDIVRTQAFVNIKPKDPFIGEYLPSVRGELRLDDPSIDPRETSQITVFVENRNPRHIENLKVELVSDSIHETRTVELMPISSSGDQKEVIFSLDLDDLTAPSKEPLKAVISTDFENRTFTFETQSVPIEIISYGGVEESLSVKRAFFKTTEVYTLENTGNAEAIGAVKIPYGPLDRPFISSPEGLELRDGFQTYLLIETDLSARSDTTITITYNYRYVALIIFLAIVGIVLYYVFRSPVVLRKETKILNRFEGGISEIKVTLVIKNRSRKDATAITVSDKLPHLVEVGKEHEIGVLPPTKVLKHKSKGTIVKWEIEQLDAGEERIMTYTVNTKLSIVGKIQLVGAVVRFTTERGKSRTSTSNSVSLSSG